MPQHGGHREVEQEWVMVMAHKQSRRPVLFPLAIRPVSHPQTIPSSWHRAFPTHLH